MLTSKTLNHFNLHIQAKAGDSSAIFEQNKFHEFINGCFPRLLEIDMMCPFCIGHHVGIRPNTSISSIKMDIRKFSFSLGYPLDT